MTTTAATQTTIRNLAQEFAPIGEWVSISDIVGCIQNTTLEEVHEALLEMGRARTIATTPESNQKALRPADRAAALWIGGQYRHYLRLKV